MDLLKLPGNVVTAYCQSTRLLLLPLLRRVGNCVNAHYRHLLYWSVNQGHLNRFVSMLSKPPQHISIFRKNTKVIKIEKVLKNKQANTQWLTFNAV